MTAFLLTWKEGGWEYADLQKMVRDFDRKSPLRSNWRLRSSRLAKTGDRVWLLEQGVGRYGIFGVGTVDGPSFTDDDGTGKQKKFSPIVITDLIDPRKGYIIQSDAVTAILNKTQLTAQSSGNPIEDSQSEALEALLGSRGVQTQEGTDWTRREIIAIVDDYLDMLAAEIAGTPYSKTEHRRVLRRSIRRSDGSIERKHENISAALRDLGLRWIKGYKPLGNSQRALREIVEAEVTLRGDEMFHPVGADAEPEGTFADPPPPRAGDSASAGRKRVARKTDMAARDAKNRTLGANGENFVVRFERRRLSLAGRRDLADKVKWSARDKGDGLGYDVESFSEEGRRIFIEVKTTCGPVDTPFYLTVAELAASEELGVDYRLYRVFDFGTERPRVYELRGSLNRLLNLVPITFRATYMGKSVPGEIAAF